MFKLFAALAIFLSSLTSEALPKIDREDIKLGKFRSRAIVRLPSGGGKRPVVIMIPGSGPNGPESIALAQHTLDGKVHSLFNELAEPLNRAGAITIQLGKPGVEFFSLNGPKFYNERMYVEATWTDILANVSDAVEAALAIPGVDANRIYLLGHSEGTQVAVDYAAIDARVKGLILLSYTGVDPYTLLEWQFFRRPFEMFVAPDIDSDHNNVVTKAEAEKWPELKWKFATGQTQVSIASMQAALRNSPEIRMQFSRWLNAPLYQQILRRGSIFEKTAKLKQDLFVFTGKLDIQTSPIQSKQLALHCKEERKKNCVVLIVPGLGHGFSEPKSPRKHKYLDATIGPIDPKFQVLLYKLGNEVF